MKLSTRKAAKKAKAARRPSPSASKVTHKKPPRSTGSRRPHSVGAKVKAPKMKAPKMKTAAIKKKRPTAVHAKPHASAGGPRSGDSDRGLYVRFENAAVKAEVMAFAEQAHISMNGFIVAATLMAIKEKWQPEMKPEPVASAATEGERRTA